MNKKVSTFHRRLNEGMEIRNFKQVDLVRATGLSKQKVNQYVSGQFEAKQDGVYILAKTLDVNEAWLMGYDVPMERNTQASSQATAAWDAKYNGGGKLARETEIFERVLTKLPMYDVPVSAGTGAWLGEGHEYEFSYFEDVPPNADFALRVRGDSMTPLYDDDDIVFIKANVMVESGQIGVFIVNGEGYLKMLQGNKLISLNEEYKPIIVEEWDSFFCAGRVIGKTRLD